MHIAATGTTVWKFNTLVTSVRLNFQSAGLRPDLLAMHKSQIAQNEYEGYMMVFRMFGEGSLGLAFISK